MPHSINVSAATASTASRLAQPSPTTTALPSSGSAASATSGQLESIPEDDAANEHDDYTLGDPHCQEQDLASAVESTGLADATSSPRTSSSSPAGSIASPNPPRSRLRSIDVPAISLPSSADVLTSLPDPRPLHVATLRSSPGTQAHDLLGTMESVLDPGTPRNVFNDLLRADRSAIPDSLWVPKIARLFADAPWLVEAFLMVVGWIGPDPLTTNHATPGSPPMPRGTAPPLHVPGFHARMPSPNYHATLVGNPLGRSVSPPGTATGWFIDHPPSPMHAVSHPSPSTSLAPAVVQQNNPQTMPPPVFHVSPVSARGESSDDGFANFQIPTILHSPVASPRESPAQSPDVSAPTPSPLGLGLRLDPDLGAEIDPESVPLAPSLLQVKSLGEQTIPMGSIHWSRPPLAQPSTETEPEPEPEARDITDEDRRRQLGETPSELAKLHQVGVPATTTSTLAGKSAEHRPGDNDQDDDPLDWVDEASSSGLDAQCAHFSDAPMPMPTSAADSLSPIPAPSKLIERYTQLGKSRAHLLHLPLCGHVPTGNPAAVPRAHRMQQQHQMHHIAHHHAHSNATHASSTHGQHGGFLLHPSIAFGIDHGARFANRNARTLTTSHAHTQGRSSSLYAVPGHPDHVQIPGPHREDPRPSPHFADTEQREEERDGAVVEGQQEPTWLAGNREHDSYSLHKALSERRLGMNI